MICSFDTVFACIRLQKEKAKREEDAKKNAESKLRVNKGRRFETLCVLQHSAQWRHRSPTDTSAIRSTVKQLKEKLAELKASAQIESEGTAAQIKGVQNEVGLGKTLFLFLQRGAHQ